MSSGNQVLTSSGSLLSLCIVQVICIVLIPLVITKDIQQDYSNVTAKESVIAADNEIYTNSSSDYTVYNTSGLITWHDDSFPTSSHHIEPADPCKAEAYFGDIALTKDEALSIKGAVFREDILNKKKKVSKPPSATHETSYVNEPDLGRPVGEHGIFDFDAIQEYQHKKLQEKLYNQKKYVVTNKLLADNESNSTQLVKALHGNVRKRGQHARKHRNNKRKSKNKPSRHAKGGQNKPSRHGQGTQHRSRSKTKKKRGQERGHRGNKRNRQQLREGLNLRQNRNATITKSKAKRNNTMDSKRDGETKRSRKHGRSNRKRMQLDRTDTSVVGTTRSGLRRETRSRGQRSRRAATAKLDRLWDNAVIPYEVEANFSGSHKALFKQAMRHWENLTCISFVERSKEDRNYIVFTERPCGCCSFVGRRGNGPQAISIGKNCDKFGIVVHELGHVIGFWHEHTRPDRDNHVAIIYKNIMPGQEYNFNKLTSNEVNSLNEPYDYESIMHYSRNTFSRWSTTYTIEPLVETKPDIHIGQRVKLSPGDIRQANKLYKCPSCGRTLQDSMGTFGSPPTRSTTTPQPLNPHQNQTPTKGQTHDNYIDNTPDIYTPPELENEYTYEIEGVDMVSSITEDNDLELEQERMIQDQPQADVLVPALPAKNMMSDAEANPILCEWRISGTHGEKIVLNITMLDLPQSHGCISDYLEIRDGHWLQSQLIGRYCEADNVPDTLVSTDSRMWIQYYSVTPGNHLGFLATYEAVCGGEILRDHGILSSPNYPDYYKPNKECVWKIGVEEHYRVALMFQSFEVENHDKCVYDYLEIRDGNDDSSPLVNKYCGYKMPPHVRSTNNRLYVKFKSDSSVQKAGFHARFIKEFDECSTNKHGCHHICVNTMGSFRCQCRIGYELHSDGKRCEDACGGYKRNNNGTIHSPSFPDPYPANKNCEWRIVAPDNYRITINFTNFELEGNNQDCEYDSVDIRSGDNNSDTLHGVFCGSELPETITSDNNIMRITFSTDNNIQKSGFSAHYFIDMDECADDNGGCQHICRNTIGAYECACHNGFTLHDNNHDCKEGGCQHDISLPVGEISSPGWPAFYPSRKHCIWRFHTTQGHRIKLEFSNFELEPHQECSYDRLEVFDSNREDVSHRIDKFCGAKEPSIIISSGNQLYITFYSDASVQRQGFHATHTTVCGGRMTATNSAKFLFSHAKYGDQNYDNKESCDWLLVAEDSNYQIRFRFLAFEVEDETDCSYDYVEVYDGNDLTAPRINRYCGNTIPPEISSSGIYLLIRFKTDDTINWKGFSGAFVLRAATTPQHEISSTTNTQTHYDRVRATQVKKITSQRYKKQLHNNNRE